MSKTGTAPLLAALFADSLFLESPGPDGRG